MFRSGRCASSGFSPAFSSVAAAAATFASTFRKSAPYGRDAITRSCARRSLAAETIFMALVICCVFLTERMRRRISIKLGITVFRYEAGFEFLDHRFHFAAQRVIQRLLGADLFPQTEVRVVDEPVELVFELAALFHRQIVQIALGSGVDDHHLLFERQRL